MVDPPRQDFLHRLLGKRQIGVGQEVAQVIGWLDVADRIGKIAARAGHAAGRGLRLVPDQQRGKVQRRNRHTLDHDLRNVDRPVGDHIDLTVRQRDDQIAANDRDIVKLRAFGKNDGPVRSGRQRNRVGRHCRNGRLARALGDCSGSSPMHQIGSVIVVSAIARAIEVHRSTLCFAGHPMAMGAGIPATTRMRTGACGGHRRCGIPVVHQIPRSTVTVCCGRQRRAQKQGRGSAPDRLGRPEGLVETRPPGRSRASVRQRDGT